MNHKILAINALLAASVGFLPAVHAAEGASAPSSVETPVAVKPAASVNATYELRGFFGSGGKTEISLREVGAESSVWYPLGEKTRGVLVEKADAKTGIAVIVVNGARQTLKLAGEGSDQTEVLSRTKQKNDAGVLHLIYAGWNEAQKAAAESAVKAPAEAVLREHPEYFSEAGSKTPAAKAAMRELLRGYTEAGNAVANSDGIMPENPENLSDKIDTVFADVTVTTMSHQAREDFAKMFPNHSVSPDGKDTVSERAAPDAGFHLFNREKFFVGGVAGAAEPDRAEALAGVLSSSATILSDRLSK